MTEADLVESLTALLLRRWPISKMAHEARSHGRCRTDICVLVRQHPRDREGMLVGVEAKLTNWSRALCQAALNAYAVDLSYVALPVARISSAALTEANRLGIGVLAVDGRDVSVAVPAQRSMPDPALRQKVMGQLVPVRGRGKVDVEALVLPPMSTSAGAA